MKNILKNTKVYLIGPMENDPNGRRWRKVITNFLAMDLNVVCFNPYEKPFLQMIQEDEQTQACLKDQMILQNYDKVREHMVEIRRYDLAMVDKSDFIICYIDPKMPTFGTMEELVIANRSRKPTFIFVEGGKSECPLWLMGMFPHKNIFGSIDDLMAYIAGMDEGIIELDDKYWRLLKPELR